MNGHDHQIKVWDFGNVSVKEIEILRIYNTLNVSREEKIKTEFYVSNKRQKAKIVLQHASFLKYENIHSIFLLFMHLLLK